MNVLFLTLIPINNIGERGIYQDLLKKFNRENHNLFIVTPVERRFKKSTSLIDQENVKILQVKTFNIQKANIIEKGIGTLAIEYQYLSAIKKYFPNIKFDLVIYSTPPITFEKVVSFVKKRDQAQSYLLLKDIFPQNAVDMGMIKEQGFIHKAFLKKERKLYQISDTIGCMSKANKTFLLTHNSFLDEKKVEVNPNSIIPVEFNVSEKQKGKIREKYGLPLNKKILVYGGNLGKPQGLDFLIRTIESNKIEDAYYLIVGNGTEFQKIQDWFSSFQPKNAKLIKSLPKDDYDILLSSCDVGLIFLDKNFTIPNFPSRLLSYLEMRLPIIAATDSVSDVGTMLEEWGCGFKVEAGNLNDMHQKVEILLHKSDLKNMGIKGWRMLNELFSVDISYDLIINRQK